MNATLKIKRDENTLRVSICVRQRETKKKGQLGSTKNQQRCSSIERLCSAAIRTGFSAL